MQFTSGLIKAVLFIVFNATVDKKSTRDWEMRRTKRNHRPHKCLQALIVTQTFKQFQ